MAKTFKAKDCGCYIDAAYGTDHALRKMADLVVPFDEVLAIELNDYPEPIDEAAELLDEATAVLNDHCEDGINFYWQAGDLILAKYEEQD